VKRWTRLAAAGMVAVSLRVTAGVAAEAVYPGKTWTVRAPAEVGLDVARLDALRDYLGGRGCVVRHGYLAYTWGEVSKRADVASACKPWYTHFLLRAVEDHKLKGLDDRVAAFEPRLKDVNAALGFKDCNISWRHLAYQTSCYGVRRSEEHTSELQSLS